VVHRYGAGIAGGSESHCRQLAEHLAVAHEVTVLTTCARDYVTWESAFPAGRSSVNGVQIVRFPVARRRDLERFAAASDRVFAGRATPEQEQDWFLENGPVAPALLDELQAHGRDYDAVLFWSFRYYTAFFGLPLVRDRAVLVPTAEEDPAIDLDLVRDFLALPAGYLFLTIEEETLVSQRAGRPLRPSAVIGAGVDAAAAAHDRTAIDRLRIPDEYVLYLGRVDRNKGCDALFADFVGYAEAGGSATLVLAGPAAMPVPEHPSIRALGFVPDGTRDALLAHARALVVPSPYESLSMVLLEAWNRGVPALVNGACRPLAGQVHRANGGLSYRLGREFAEGLSYLLSHPAERAALGQAGLAYVEREYRWPSVLARVETVLGAIRQNRIS
jgi:glycosyltransferase involved in cell wall biosynthesis